MYLKVQRVGGFSRQSQAVGRQRWRRARWSLGQWKRVGGRGDCVDEVQIKK